MSESEQEKRETLADIVADIRKRADCAERHGYGVTHNDGVAMLLRSIADRIEAAWKRERDELVYAYDPTKAGRSRAPDGSAYALEAMREPVTGSHAVGNAAAMREALNKIGNAAAWIAESCNDQQMAKYMNDIIAIVQSAPSAPPRQCDVGTAEEQAERYGRYCDKLTRDGLHCENCPCCGKISFGKCEFAWAQMPYEEGGDK